jgi:hypothetical protein
MLASPSLSVHGAKSMRYMIIVKSTRESGAGAMPVADIVGRGG